MYLCMYVAIVIAPLKKLTAKLKVIFTMHLNKYSGSSEEPQNIEIYEQSTQQYLHYKIRYAMYNCTYLHKINPQVFVHKKVESHHFKEITEND